MNLFLDYHSREPIYEQIKTQITGLIGQELLKPNEQLPSLRQLSAELSININTIKRAFSELESAGIIYSVAGKGVFVSPTAKKDNIAATALQGVETAISKAKKMGATQIDIMNIAKKLFEGDESVDRN